MNKVTNITLSQFQNQQIIWVDYEDGTYRAIFIDEN